jgi:glyoxylase-like metal-dependent hydrolase (beta-lactamase superfamily II)
VRLVADGVHLLGGFPPNAINAYLVDDVLVDAGTRLARRRILRQVRSRGVRTHVLTHAHPDHFGSSHALCEELAIPLWCGEEDAAVVESGMLGPLTPAHPVARRLREGDEVAGFTVIDAPGHSPGQVAYWREADRVLICGDVYFNIAGRLTEPWKFLSEDPARNRESMRKLAALSPALVLFGHGPPLRDTEKFVRFGRGV